MNPPLDRLIQRLNQIIQQLEAIEVVFAKTPIQLPPFSTSDRGMVKR